MNPLDPVLGSAVICAALYLLLAVVLVHAHRKSRVGFFVTLNGMASYLVTLPVALLIESFGRKFDFRNHRQMTKAIALCAILLFTFVFGVMSFARYVWTLPALPN